MTVVVEVETKKGKRTERVPRIAGLALVRGRGTMGAVEDIGKSHPPSQKDIQGTPGIDVALLGVGHEVQLKSVKNDCILFRRHA